MGVTTQSIVGFSSDEQREFTVRFEAYNAVDNTDACILEASGPANIGFFVKPSFEFDDDRDFLTWTGMAGTSNLVWVLHHRMILFCHTIVTRCG